MGGMGSVVILMCQTLRADLPHDILVLIRDMY